jgi:hypothetical protein
MIDDIGTGEIIFLSVAVAAIYPVVWTFHRIRKLGKILDFEENSHN